MLPREKFAVIGNWWPSKRCEEEKYVFKFSGGFALNCENPWDNWCSVKSAQFKSSAASPIIYKSSHDELKLKFRSHFSLSKLNSLACLINDVSSTISNVEIFRKPEEIGCSVLESSPMHHLLCHPPPPLHGNTLLLWCAHFLLNFLINSAILVDNLKYIIKSYLNSLYPCNFWYL